MVQKTVGQAYQDMLDAGFEGALKRLGVDSSIAEEVAKAVNEGVAARALTNAGKDPNQLVFVHDSDTSPEDGQVIVPNNPVIVPNNNGPEPGRRMAGLAIDPMTRQTVVVDATPEVEVEKARVRARHLGM